MVNKVLKAVDQFRLVGRDGRKPEIDETDELLTFKDVVIAREIVQQYEQGIAYKPADELEAAAWTADGMWATLYVHPYEQLIVDRNDVRGRMVKFRFVKNLLDHGKTGRPNRRGIVVDVELFKKLPKGGKGIVLTGDDLKLLKSGDLMDVSIGFTYIEDMTPGTFEGEAYDFVQRDILINHLVVACEEGRCSMPFCGLAADGLTVDTEPKETDTEILIPAPGEGTKKVNTRISLNTKKGIDVLYSGKDKKIWVYIFKKSNESGEKWTMTSAKAWVKSYHKDSIKDLFLALAADQDSDELREVIKQLLKDLENIFKRIDEITSKVEPLYSEQYVLNQQMSFLNAELEAYRERLYWEILGEGDQAPKTPAERAMQHYKIQPAEWEALSAEKKAELIAGLPPLGTGRESADVYRKAWVQVAKAAWDEMGIPAEDWLITSEDVKNKLFADLVRRGELDLSGEEKAWYEFIDWKDENNAEAYEKLPDAIKEVLKEKELSPPEAGEGTGEGEGEGEGTGEGEGEGEGEGAPEGEGEGEGEGAGEGEGEGEGETEITETPDELMEEAEKVIEQTEKTLADPNLGSNEPL